MSASEANYEDFWSDPTWSGIFEPMGLPKPPEKSLDDQVRERLIVLRSEDNGGTPPSGDRVPIILLAGAIKWWWGATCVDCGHYDDYEIMRGQPCLAAPHRLCHNNYVWWNSIEHRHYVEWREYVRDALIAAGYLTYAPWMAFKGQWDERAQAINDAVIKVADAVVVLSPTFAITEGTDSEIAFAKQWNVPIIECEPPKLAADGMQAKLKVDALLEAL